MKILKRASCGEIALVRAENLRGHEELNPTRLEALTEEIRKDGELKYPIIVDRNSLVILDGHHRYFALLKLGCNIIPSLLVDYNDPCIKVSTWKPVIRTEKNIETALQALDSAGFKTLKSDSREFIDNKLDTGEAGAGAILSNEKKEFLIFRSDEGETFERVISEIRQALAVEGIRKDLEYVKSSADCRGKDEDDGSTMVILIPKITKETVITRGFSRKKFPPKTTRHLLPEREYYPIKLGELRENTPSRELA